MTAQETAEPFFDEVRVPEENLLGENPRDVHRGVSGAWRDARVQSVRDGTDEIIGRSMGLGPPDRQTGAHDRGGAGGPRPGPA